MLKNQRRTTDVRTVDFYARRMRFASSVCPYPCRSTHISDERVYYPIHPESIPVELVLACMISAIDVANKLMVEQVGSYCYVSRLIVRDYVPNPNAVDDLVDKVGPMLQSAGQRVSDVVGKVLGSGPT